MDNIESNLVGLLVNDPAALSQVTVRPEWFTDGFLQNIVKDVIDAKERGTFHDLVTLGEKYPQHVAELVEMTKSAPMRLDVIPYAGIVHDRYIVRQASKEASKILGSQSADEVMQAHSNIGSLIRDNSSGQKEDLGTQTAQALAKVLDDKKSFSDGLYGVQELDEYTRGMAPGDLVIVAARPGMGKTGMALNAAMKSQENGRVLFFSREMPSDQLLRRLWASTGRTNMQQVFKEPREHADSIRSAAECVQGMNIEIFEDVVYVEDIANIVARECMKGDVACVIVDYLQLCKLRKFIPSREREVSEMSWAFKQMAKQNKIPLMLLSQLSRECEKTETKMPEVHHLRDSGSLEQDASVVILLYRSSEYDITDESGSYYDMIKIAKNRNGEKADMVGNLYSGLYQTWNWKQMQKVVESKPAQQEGPLPF